MREHPAACRPEIEGVDERLLGRGQAYSRILQGLVPTEERRRQPAALEAAAVTELRAGYNPPAIH